jgi:hypothetical protein
VILLSAHQSDEKRLLRKAQSVQASKVRHSKLEELESSIRDFLSRKKEHDKASSASKIYWDRFILESLVIPSMLWESVSRSQESCSIRWKRLGTSSRRNMTSGTTVVMIGHDLITAMGLIKE